MGEFNTDIKERISAAGLTRWQVAYKLNVSAQTLYLWLRVPLSEDHKNRILRAIDELKGDDQIA